MASQFLFVDESGNFDFRWPTGHRGGGPTRYFAVGSLVVESERELRRLRRDLESLRDDLTRRGVQLDAKGFHCTTDSQVVRDEVFAVLAKHPFKVDVTILDKPKAQPQTRRDDATFYKYAMYYHLKFFAKRYFKAGDDLTVVSASIGTKKTRKSFEAAVLDVVDQCCDVGVTWCTAHRDSASDPALQAVDYALWAVMRDFERGDGRARALIEDKIHSVYNLWSLGSTYYYGPKAKKSA